MESATATCSPLPGRGFYAQAKLSVASQQALTVTRGSKGGGLVRGNDDIRHPLPAQAIGFEPKWLKSFGGHRKRTIKHQQTSMKHGKAILLCCPHQPHGPSQITWRHLGGCVKGHRLVTAPLGNSTAWYPVLSNRLHFGARVP